MYNNRGSGFIINEEREYKPDKTLETENFIINYNEIDEEVIDKVAHVLEDNYNRITKHLQETLDEKVCIEIQHNINELHNALDLKNAPLWIRGGLGKDRIIIASPLNPPKGSDFYNVVNTAVHEFAHFIIHKINRNIPRWLDEGIASYEAKDNSEVWIVNTVKSGIKENKIPSLKDLDTGGDFESFFNRDGYQYSYTVVEAIVNLYGYDTLSNLIKSACNFEKILKVKEAEFENKWIQYIRDNYRNSN